LAKYPIERRLIDPSVNVIKSGEVFQHPEYFSYGYMNYENESDKLYRILMELSLFENVLRLVRYSMRFIGAISDPLYYKGIQNSYDLSAIEKEIDLAKTTSDILNMDEINKKNKNNEMKETN